MPRPRPPRALLRPAVPPHRRLCWLRGPREQVVARARAVVPAGACWISDVLEGAVPVSRAGTLLGRSEAVVVLDLWGGYRADVLGQVHGLVRGGGWLVLLDDAPGARWVAPWEGLAVWPFTAADAGAHTRARLERLAPLARSPEGVLPVAPFSPRGTPEQGALIARLCARWRRQEPSVTVLLADRGRGKSAALGIALAAAGVDAEVTGPSRAAVAEVLRFRPEARFVTPGEGGGAGVLVVDEAAALPVPILRALVAAAAGHVVLATTVHGYEGTGRGFLHGLLGWLRGRGRVHEERLQAPIRWGAGDPLEAAVFDALALEAEPAPAPAPGPIVVEPAPGAGLAADPALLSQAFGLLVGAHYRTTPGDLQRILDAPNLDTWVARRAGAVVGATVVAREGALDPERVAALQRGERLRGHALAEVLVCHAQRPEAGALSMRRSVRLVTHPAARRLGIASRLVDEVHARYRPDLFGTLFGATPAVLAFRQRCGYRLIWVGVGRGARRGEPTAVMVRPVSDAAVALVDALAAELARSWPVLRRLLCVGPLPVERATLEALQAGLPAPLAWNEDAIERSLSAWLAGRRTFEAAAPALVASRLPRGLPELAALDDLAHGRTTWAAVRAALGYGSVPAAMRGLRRRCADALGRVAR